MKKKGNKVKNAYIESSGIILDEEISKTLEKNYMPYAMSVIISRALPEIDGFKPSHRKILYTMYKMGLLNNSRTKSANIVGQTMKLNPHGDAAIYETMVRLSRGYQALIHPYVDSKGNFGKYYSRDMAFAASRYTEAKLDKICNEFFSDIDKNTVEFVDNYDSTVKEPVLLPCTFPSILVNCNIGIAVGMASSISSFNLKEVCETTIKLIKNPKYDITKTLKGPDFSGGGFLMYDETAMNLIYSTGKGGVKIRGRYSFDASSNCIDITEIPPSTTVEAIIDKIVECVKNGKIKEISDVRDETDLNGLKITIDLKKGADSKRIIAKLYKYTTLEDSFSCNFNILIKGAPKTLGVREILFEWIDFRRSCIKRRVVFELDKKNKRLHLLNGLSKILLDIDGAIKIIRETDLDSDVISNLMVGFKIDEIQAEYIAEIKLRHLNKEYILKRLQEIKLLEEDISLMKDILENESKLDNIIIDELKNVIKLYGIDRNTMIIYDYEEYVINEEDDIKDYNVNIFLTKQGYFKKVTDQSLRLASDHKIKDDDEFIYKGQCENRDDILFFTDKFKVYKAKIRDFADMKSSMIGDFLPNKIGIEKDENIIFLITTADYSENILFFYDNGRIAKFPLNLYETKTNRKKLLNAYSNDAGKLVYLTKESIIKDYSVITNQNYCGVISSSLVPLKVTKNTKGVIAIKLKIGDSIKAVSCDMPENIEAYRIKMLGKRPVALKDKNQITF